LPDECGEHLLAVIETEEKDEKETNAAPDEPAAVAERATVSASNRSAPLPVTTTLCPTAVTASRSSSAPTPSSDTST